MSKPVKIKNYNYRIDISNTRVHIVKTDRHGRVMKAGTAPAPTMPLVPDAEYIKGLGAAIKAASKNARLGPAMGMPCLIVTSGSHIILRRFTWPDLPEEALLTNAEHDLAPYLPESSDNYVISTEILNRDRVDDDYSEVQVLVAAMPKVCSQAITQACRKAGFVVARIDVRENIRNKIMNHYFNCLDLKPKHGAKTEDSFEISRGTYAILILGAHRVKLSLYVKGIFYSNHYFAVDSAEPDEVQQEELDELMDSSKTDLQDAADEAAPFYYAPGISGSDGQDVIDTLIGEVGSVVDYLFYRDKERISFISVAGHDHIPDFEKRLREHLGTLVYRYGRWIAADIKHLRFPNEVSIMPYLDTYATTLPAFVSESSRINLAPGQKAKAKGAVAASQQKVSAVPLLIVAGFMTVGLGAGIAVPSIMQAGLEHQHSRLSAELAAFTITEADVMRVNAETASVEQRIRMIDDFYEEFTHARTALPVLYRLRELYNIELFDINSGGIYDSLIVVGGDAPDLVAIANAIIYLREHDLMVTSYSLGIDVSVSDEEIAELFEITNLEQAVSTPILNLASASFSLDIVPRTHLGYRPVDVEFDVQPPPDWSFNAGLMDRLEIVRTDDGRIFVVGVLEQEAPPVQMQIPFEPPTSPWDALLDILQDDPEPEPIPTAEPVLPEPTAEPALPTPPVPPEYGPEPEILPEPEQPDYFAFNNIASGVDGFGLYIRTEFLVPDGLDYSVSFMVWDSYGNITQRIPATDHSPPEPQILARIRAQMRIAGQEPERLWPIVHGVHLNVPRFGRQLDEFVDGRLYFWMAFAEVGGDMYISPVQTFIFEEGTR